MPLLDSAIREAYNEGYSKKELRDLLLEKGWPAKFIDPMIKNVYGTSGFGTKRKIK